ncbi:TlpA family protein disulfide reductase [Azospira restricta]|uniref:TlpA family protein disulfide reductase n=1 Tax=Azospira restricta TaxID=404405 RepID=A0A974PVT5_9RHOO|nr:TlpA disulfide reductase family protein [Azospira restricta]QRJ62432.1 TlpA family protein disulfide reductase [Azospira restricta]
MARSPSRNPSIESPGAGRRRLLQLLTLPLCAAACGREALPRAAVGVGDPFPSFELPDLQRRPRRLADFLGRPLLLNFWATWCPPCRAEMAGLQVLHRGLAAYGGAVVAVSVDDDINLVREFVLQVGVEFPVLLDTGRAFATAALRLSSYPTSFVLRRDGRVGEVVVGARAWEAPDELPRLLAAAA